MPVAVPMGGQPRGDDEVFQAAVTTPVSSGRRKQKQTYSPKTPLPSRAAAAGAVPSTPSAAVGSRQAAAESPSGSTSTTTTNSPPSLAPSSTWTLYDNPCFCSSHFYPDLQHRHRRRHHHHHRKPIGATTSLGTVLERERAMVALERERAMREEAEAFRVELARERKRREEAEERARKAAEEGARWKEEVERAEAEVRAAREAGVVQEQRARAEMAEAMGRFEEEKRRLQMQIQMQVRPADACGDNSAGQCDRSKDQHQQQQPRVQQHQVASPLATTSTAPPNPLTPATTPSQPQKQRQQPRRDASIENPHIRRGIIGFVEFPRVVGRSRGASTKSGGAAPPKLECQKAQLRVLLKGGGGGKVAPVAGFPSSAPPAHNLVM